MPIRWLKLNFNYQKNSLCIFLQAVWYQFGQFHSNCSFCLKKTWKRQVDVDQVEKGRLKKAGGRLPLEKGRLKKASRRRPGKKAVCVCVCSPFKPGQRQPAFFNLVDVDQVEKGRLTSTTRKRQVEKNSILVLMDWSWGINQKNRLKMVAKSLFLCNIFQLLK